jgi:hypothetical protein
MGPSAGGKPSAKQPSSGERSQSEVIGVILIFGLVMAGSFAILALGATAIGDTEQKLSGDRAEKTLTQFDSKAGLVALGESDSQKVSLPERGNEDFSVNESKGTLSIEVTNITSGSTVSWGDPLVEVELGVLEFKNDDRALAYQGGGVFRAGSGNGSMVSPPEFHYRNGTLTLPIVNITGEGTLGPTATISHSDENKTFPLTKSVNHTNPLDNHRVKLTVQSEYYEGWGQYFEERTDGEVKYDHDSETVTLVLKTPVGNTKIKKAVSGTASDGNFYLAGSGSGPTVIADSYNSSMGEYAVTKGGNGNITVAGDFEVTGNNKKVRGTVETGGKLSCGSNIEITGDVFYESEDIHKNCDIDGDEHSNSDVDGISPVNDFVNNTVSKIKADNDNSGTAASGGTISYSGGAATLSAGDYYLDRLEVSDGETLFLNTNGGDVRIGIEKYAELEGTSEIKVLGDGTAELYINGEAKSDGHHFDMYSSGSDYPTVTTDGPRQNSTQFWVYGQDDMEGQIYDNQGNAHFEGVIYAPTNPSGDSKVEVTGAQVFGGIVAGEVNVDQGQGGAIHFDEALKQEQAIPENTKVVKITFLHITVNEIEID